MKTTLITVFLVCSVASLNAKYGIIETYEEDYEDDANMTEDGEEISNKIYPDVIY
jgi:hypothetical protein